ncbi:hypothetical protein RHSIM_Rhsim07G0252300 [Rhododendron simsii]|uniref:Uncharacterized protein n=1 Tax=Rhododendron simsii TaxID=118357 RepID=A0A834LIW9_RHOSS|nr:hypothetical protein RHSIM_Rhsim07G0252300 [Rhododendron simsii]
MDIEIRTRATTPSSRFALWNYVVANRSWILCAMLVLIALHFFVLAIWSYFQATEISVETTTLHGGVVERWLENFKGRTIYVLGDSTVASGNFEFTVFPYGVDLPLGSATTEKSTTGNGKFSNANDNGSPIPVPYRSLGGKRRVVILAYFASGGCGILDWIHLPIFHRVQVCLGKFNSCSIFGFLQLQEGSFLWEAMITSSLFVEWTIRFCSSFVVRVQSGVWGWFLCLGDPEGFANELVTHFKSTLKSLYARGARKFLINNVGPIGCIPNNRNRVTNDCNEEKNHGAAVYNGKLEIALRELAKEFEATFVLANSQEMFEEFNRDYRALLWKMEPGKADVPMFWERWLLQG